PPASRRASRRPRRSSRRPPPHRPCAPGSRCRRRPFRLARPGPLSRRETNSFELAMRLATWNVNSLKARLGRVEEWLGYAAPDVLCMQETKLADADFPTMAFSALGYDSAHCGEGRWNGVAILSRVGLDDVVAGFSDQVEDESAEARLLSATCAGV